MATSRIVSAAVRLAPFALLALAGAAQAAPLSWQSTCASTNWFDVCTIGVCNVNLPLRANNFNLTNCFFNPAFPTGTDDVNLGANTVVLNGSTTISSLQLSAGGNFTIDGDLNVGAGGFTNAGTVTKASARSTFGVFNSSGMYTNLSNIQYFQGCTFNNTGTVEWVEGDWQNFSGVNSFNSSGTVRKTSAATMTQRVPTTLTGGTVSVLGGDLNWLGTSLTIAPSVSWSVVAGANNRFRNSTLSGTINSTAAGFLGSDANISIGAGNLVLNVGGTGYQRVGGDITMAGRTVTNNALYLRSNACSDLNGVFVNNGTYRHLNNIHYFQNEQLTNNPGATLELSEGDWQNYSGTNAVSQNGTLNKVGANTMTYRVPTASTGAWNVNNGVLSLLNMPLDVTAGTWSVAAPGTLEFSGVTLRGSLTSAPAGLFRTVGNVAIAAAAAEGLTLNVAGTGFQWNNEFALNGQALTNSALFIDTNVGHSMLNGAFVNNGTYRELGGTTYFQTLAYTNNGLLEMSGGDWQNYSGVNSFTQSASGTLRKLDSTTNQEFRIPSMINGGAVDVQAGTLTWRNAPVSSVASATWSVAAGANNAFRGSTLSGAFTGNPLGAFGPDTNWAQGGNMLLNIGGTGFAWPAGEGSGNGWTLTNNNRFVMNGGNRSWVATTFNNYGVWDFSATILYFQTLAATNGGTLNFSGGEWQSYSGPNSFTNTGTFTKTSTDTRTFSVPTVNTGTFNVAAGGFGSMNYIQNSGSTLLAGGAMSGNVTLNGGTFTGSGNGINFSNVGAVVDIDPPGAATVGTIALSGVYNQSSGGTLIIDVASDTSFDKITNDQYSTVNGTINVRVAPGYDPLRKAFHIVTAQNFYTAGGSPKIGTVTGTTRAARVAPGGSHTILYFPCSPADVADDQGNVPPRQGVPNNGINEGDYNGFFNGFFTNNRAIDIADDQGTPFPPFSTGGTGDATNNGINEGDYNAFFNAFFNGCQFV